MGGARGWGLTAAVLLLAMPAVDASEISGRLFTRLQAERTLAHAPPLERDPALDALARRRAAEIAARPAKQRLAGRTPVKKLLLDSGGSLVVGAWEWLDLERGVAASETGLLRRWKRTSGSWNRLLDPRTDRIGLASAQAADGWRIFLAIFVEELDLPADLESWARATAEQVNRKRTAHGLRLLSWDPELAVVAREHSEEMAREGYLAHQDRAGLQPADRIRRAGIAFRAAGENIARGRGHRDPIMRAIEGWMESPGHRAAILDGDFERTGVGIAVAEDGTVYFTQLFTTPPVTGDELRSNDSGQGRSQ